MTVNYLGHFEGPGNFGCNAGRKMIYVDAFGEVSPCVFTPMSFGNVRERSLREIWADMSRFSLPSPRLFHERQLFPLSEIRPIAGCRFRRTRPGDLMKDGRLRRRRADSYRLLEGRRRRSA